MRTAAIRRGPRGGILLLLLAMAPGAGCASLGISLYYERAALPETRIVRNIRYYDGDDSDPILNRLDLFLPDDSKGRGWPTMVFVHGGSWTEGDKDLKVAGADVYGNIGRFFASQGIGTAVISYRLLPSVDWKAQVLDVARAVAWVHRHVEEYHGNPDAIFLAGHSAGAQLASRVALDPAPLTTLGLSPRILCGVIPISGVGYDFLDEETYRFGKEQGAVQAIFHKDDISRKLRKKLSPINFVTQDAPPFLILDAGEDPEEIRHASQRLEHAFEAAGARSQLYLVPQVSHRTMILALSHPRKMPAGLMTVFMKSSACGSAKR